MTDEGLAAYIARCRAARAAQGLPDGIEDEATLDLLADVLAQPASTTPTRRQTPVTS